MKKALTLVGIALAALFLAMPLHAQPAGGGGEPSPAKMEQRLKQVRARVLRERVGLSEKKALKVEAIFERFAPEAKRIEKRMRKANARLRYLFEIDSNDQKAYKMALDKQRRAHKAMVKLREREFKALQKVLKPKQQAKLLMALKELQKKVRREMRRRKRAGKRGGPPPGGAGEGDPGAWD